MRKLLIRGLLVLGAYALLADETTAFKWRCRRVKAIYPPIVCPPTVQPVENKDDIESAPLWKRTFSVKITDKQIMISSAKDVAEKRRALIEFIWGAEGFPHKKLPSSVARNIKSPVDNLSNLLRVDEIRFKMDADETGLAYHFIPERSNNQLVILHHGHGNTLNDSPALEDTGYGMQRTINAFLQDGYAVLGMYMPHFYGPSDTRDDHDAMFKIKTKSGSPMQFFLEPVAVCLNYVKTKSDTDQFPHYQDFHMAGLSGGGWTTTVYSAIDPTIKFSFPVAGSIPLYLRFGGSIGDSEQMLPAFYKIAGYPDLYVMGSHGSGRKQIQILNRRDDCCFGERQHDTKATGMSFVQAMRDYEGQVRQVLFKLDSGTFRLEIDETAPSHMISHNTIVNVILAELNHGRRPIGAAASTDAFVRGVNGHLWHHGPDGWQDTGLAMAGVPAVLHGAGNKVDVFFRDPGNRLKHAFRKESGWATEDLAGVVITDPVAVSWGPGRFDVVALGSDYRFYHWWRQGSSKIQQERVSDKAKGLGMPALVTWGPNRLDLFYRGWDRTVYHLSKSGAAAWTLDKLEPAIIDFPSAVTTGANTLLVFVRGESKQLWEGRQTKGGPWNWTSLSAVTKSSTTSLSGTPSAAARGNLVKVYLRTAAGNLSSFSFSEGAWSFSNHGQSITGSPTATPDGAFARDRNARLLQFGTDWKSLGGSLD